MTGVVGCLQGETGLKGRPGPVGPVGFGEPGLPVRIRNGLTVTPSTVSQESLSVLMLKVLRVSKVIFWKILLPKAFRNLPFAVVTGCVLLQGPPGVAGVQGNPGPPGEGLPGQKVIIMMIFVIIV